MRVIGRPIYEIHLVSIFSYQIWGIMNTIMFSFTIITLIKKKHYNRTTFDLSQMYHRRHGLPRLWHQRP